MGKIEENVEKVKQRQSQEEFNKDSAYWKEKARLLKQKEVKEQKEKARKEFAPEPKEKSSGALGRVGGFLKERSIAIAHESRDLRPRKQNYGGSLPMGGGGFNGGGDLFGMRNMGNPFSPPRPEPAPRRKKRRKSRTPPRRSAPQRSGGMDMMGIPKHMRWMF